MRLLTMLKTVLPLAIAAIYGAAEYGRIPKTIANIATTLLFVVEAVSVAARVGPKNAWLNVGWPILFLTIIHVLTEFIARLNPDRNLGEVDADEQGTRKVIAVFLVLSYLLLLPSLIPKIGHQIPFTFVVLLLAASFIDFRTKEIPDAIELGLLALFFLNAGSETRVSHALLGALLGWAVTIVFTAIGFMGYGDLKLMVVLGLFFGIRIIDVYCLSFVIGGIPAIVLKCVLHKHRVEIPLGQFIALAAIYSWVTDFAWWTRAFADMVSFF